jgi:polyisoprenoid-binding protein YceI
MKRILAVLVGILAIGLIVWGVAGYRHSQGVDAKVSDLTGEVISDFSGDKVIVKTEESLLEFQGYKVGGSHIGTFNDWEGSVYTKRGKIVGVEGIAKIDSIKTDNTKVDLHLQSEDFFDAEKYPEIKFISTQIDYDNSEVSGILEFHGEKKEITFPVEIRDNEISGEFYLDTTPFKFKFTGVNPEVRIKFKFVTE